MTAHGSTAPPCHILVVDDDPGIRSLIARYLDRNGCATGTAADTREMRARLETGRVDLIVLDLMMPGEDGLSALRRLQSEGDVTPVILLSAVGSDVDRIIGLEVGADDYLAKPFNPRELLARIHTVLRHRRRSGGERVAGGSGVGMLTFAGWRMDVAGRVLVEPGGRCVVLTDGEFSLLRAFAEHPRQVLTRDRLLDVAKGQHCDFYDRAIDVQVSRLRRKLGAPEMIRTVRNEGYMFVPGVSAER